jgi:transaldolase
VSSSIQAIHFDCEYIEQLKQNGNHDATSNPALMAQLQTQRQDSILNQSKVSENIHRVRCIIVA